MSADRMVLCVLQGCRLLATPVPVALVTAKAVAGNGLGPAAAMVPGMVVEEAGRERVLAELVSAVVVAMGAG